MGGAVPLGLVGRRRHGVARVALCHGDCWGRRRVGGAAPLGLVAEALRGCGVGGAVPLGLRRRHGVVWGAVPLGLVAGGCRAVPLGLVWEASCAMGIGGEGIAWDWWASERCRCTIGIGEGVARVALCHGEWRGRRNVGGAVPLGLVWKVSRGWRCGIGIGGEGVAWVALCHWD